MSTTAEESWLLGATRSQAREFYAVLGVDLSRAQGVEARVRCFSNAEAHKNEDRKPACNVNLLTGLWHCHACGAKGNAYQAAQALGRHDAKELAKQYGLFLETEPTKLDLPKERDIRKWNDALLVDEKLTRRLHVLKGWTRPALRRCSVGWNGSRITFIVRDRKLKRIGYVQYLPGGEPKAIAKGKRDLFPAPEVTSRTRPVFLVEGEPDAVSVWSVGHQAIAVPGAQSWRLEMGSRLANRKVVVLADCDGPGRELAQKVKAVVPTAKVIDIAPERENGYDIGDFIAEATENGAAYLVTRLLDDFARDA